MYEEYDAVVYDLDGTLVRLAVDWAAVERAVGAVLVEAGVDPDELTAWELLAAAEEAGVGDRVEGIIADHEREGAARAERLPHADEVAGVSIPVGVCSLNCEAACRTALERHDLAAHVEVVVGRDSVGARKPDPEPLLEAVRRLGVPPERAVFVGDSERDAVTAERAGTAFEYVGDGPSGH